MFARIWWKSAVILALILALLIVSSAFRAHSASAHDGDDWRDSSRIGIIAHPNWKGVAKSTVPATSQDMRAPLQPYLSPHTQKADVEYWAVIVGVADYPGTLNDLDYTDDDAYDVRDVLLASTNWEADHITMLIDSEATKSNIQNAINWMEISGDDNDVFFFFFSGHGTRLFADQIPIDEADGRDEALCQYDHNSVGSILDDELGVWLSTLPGSPVLVAIDTCFSGGMIKAGQGQSRGLRSAGVPNPGDGFARDLDDAIAGVVLTACDDDEESWEIGVLQNGLFTYYFMEGLAGPADDQGNGDGSVSMEEAFDYLYPFVFDYPLPPGYEQHPQEYDNWPGEAALTILIPPTSTPTVTTLTDISLGASEGQPTAILYGTITHDGGEACQYRFEYGTDSGEPYAYHTDWTGSIISGESFSETISGLGEETTYYYRAQAKNTAGTSSGDERSFTTPKLFSVTLGTSPYAVSLTVDGTIYSSDDLPKSFSWANGSVHDFVAPSPVASSEEGTQYVFTSWSPDGDISASKIITVSGNATYTANYDTQHYLTVESDYGDPSGEGWYDEGNTTSIGSAKETIIDDDNTSTRYVFLNWIVDGVDKTENPVSISMDAPHTAVADYKTQHFLTVSSAYGDEPSGEDWYDEGTTATTGTAEQVVSDDDTDDTQYVFLNWIVDGDDETENPVSITTDAPHTATTEYKTQHYLTVNSEYGDPEGQGWHDEGDTATASVTSPVGTIIRKVFNNWGGDSTDTSSSATILMDEPKTVTANWRNDYLYVYIIVGGLLVVAGVFSTIVITSKRRRYRRRVTQ